MSARRYNSFCSGVVRMLCVFPEHRCSKTVLHIWEDKTTAPQVSVAALVRARKTRFKPASHVCMTNLCRTVDCTPYLSSAPLCFCGEKSDDRPAKCAAVQHRNDSPAQRRTAATECRMFWSTAAKRAAASADTRFGTSLAGASSSRNPFSFSVSM